MKIEIENAIEILSKKVNDKNSPDEALKFTQAALNLAHVLSVLNNIGDYPSGSLVSGVEAQVDVDAIVKRFLTWRLPETFNPDGGVSFEISCDQSRIGWPTGTNLFNAYEARKMVEYILAIKGDDNG